MSSVPFPSQPSTKHCDPPTNSSHTRAYAATSATSPLAPASVARRNPIERDVEIENLFCGVCLSDAHPVRNEWSAGPTVYPIVPGHEIVGRVLRGGGTGVTTHRAGDVVGVGCLVDSDHSCPKCRANLEQVNEAYQRLLRSDVRYRFCIDMASLKAG